MSSLDLLSVLELSTNDFILFTNQDFISNPFIFDHLLQTFAKKGFHLLLILLSNNWSHYRSIAAKSGLNLKTLQEKQLIHVIDILAEEQEFEFNSFATDLDKRLSLLSANSVVLVDDLSLLFTLGLDFKTIYKFVHKLRVSCLQKNTILGIGTHLPTEEEDEELHRFVVTIAHKSDIWCQTSKTSSGYSPLISGCLHINQRHKSIEKQFNYKISERSVKLMPFGTQLY